MPLHVTITSEGPPDERVIESSVSQERHLVITFHIQQALISLVIFINIFELLDSFLFLVQFQVTVSHERVLILQFLPLFVRVLLFGYSFEHSDRLNHITYVSLFQNVTETFGLKARTSAKFAAVEAALWEKCLNVKLQSRYDAPLDIIYFLDCAFVIFALITAIIEQFSRQVLIATKPVESYHNDKKNGPKSTKQTAHL